MAHIQILFGLLLIILTVGCKAGGSRTNPLPDLFYAPAAYRVGTHPTCIQTGDFNSDGALDLITCNMGSHNLSVLLGNDDGTFNDHIVTPVGAQPQRLTSGHFTDDSYPDVAVFDSINALLIILKGNGDGTFTKIQTIELHKTPTSILSADFNDDRHLDIAVSFRLDQVIIFSGDGQGFFKRTYDFDPGDTPTWITSTDINQDGKPDLIIANNGFIARSIAIFHGNGDGTFSKSANIPTRYVPLIVETGHFTRDTIIDIVVIYGERSTLGLLHGQADGTYKDPIYFGAQGGPSGLITGDLNHDGHLDLAVSNNLTHNLSILLNKGDGSFIQPPIDYHSGRVPTSIAGGEFVKGKPIGIAVANNGNDSVSVFTAKKPRPTPKG